MKKKKLVDKFILPIFLVAVIILSITATFFHNILREKSHELENHLASYKPMIENRDHSYKLLLNQLKDKKINIENFYKEYNLITENYKNEHQEYLRIKKQMKSEQSILGYTSFKNFLLGFGIRFFALIVSLFYFSSKIKKHYTSANQKVFFLIISSSFVLTSAYWFTWSLVYKVNSVGEYDFEQWHQNLLLFIAPIIILSSSYFLFKHHQTIEDKFKKVIRNIFGYIYESKEDLKEDKKQEHILKRGQLIKETIENVG
ncbi:hypothetical protein [Kordia jejudonensis]|uniref:hypothetical protein n=1 Tax=Kordia jejudonensis TaxID=1348245 RepID=UPI0006295350|nr:hypothetical protein [Kordia jejudonensis]